MAALYFGQPLKKLTALANDFGKSAALGVGYNFFDSLGRSIWGIFWDSNGNPTWKVYAAGTAEDILNVRCTATDRRIQMRNNSDKQVFRFSGSSSSFVWFTSSTTALVAFTMGTTNQSVFTSTASQSMLKLEHAASKIILDSQGNGTDTNAIGKLLTGAADAPLFMTGTITTSTDVDTDSGTTTPLTNAVANEDYTLQLTLQSISGIFADQAVDGSYDPAAMTITWSIKGSQSSGPGVSWVLSYTLVHKRAGLFEAL